MKYLFSKISKINIFLLLILILAIFLRLLGTNPGYDHPHPDEPTITDLAKRITLQLNFEPHAYYYGSLLSIIYGLLNFVLLIPTSILFISRNNHLFEDLFNFQSLILLEKIFLEWNLFLISGKYFEYWARYETAILSSFTVVVIYLLGKKLFSKNVGFITAYLLAINYRHVLSSHFALADAPVALFATLSILLSYNLLQNKLLKNYILAGIGLALALSVKYFIYCIPAFIICHLLAWRQDTLKQYWLNFKNPNFILRPIISLILMISLFFIINPFLILNSQEAQYQMEYNSTRYGFTGSLSDIVKPITWYPIYYLYKLAIGEYLSLFIMLGIVIGIYKYPLKTFILLSTLLPFFYFFLVLSGSTHGRTYSAIIPLLLLFAGISINTVLNWIFRKTWLKNTTHINLLTILFVFLITVPMLKSTFETSYSFFLPSNKNHLFTWLTTELPSNKKLVQFWGVPIPSTLKNDLLFLSPDENDYLSVQELQASKLEYVAMGTDAGNLINGVFWMENDEIVKQAFFNDQFLTDILEDKYASLVTRELSYYRITEFTKPSLYSLDPAYFVAKIPQFDIENQLALTYDYIKHFSANWSTFSYEKSPFYNLQIRDSKLIVLSTKEKCITPFTKFVSQKLPIQKDKLYILSAKAKSSFKNETITENGFLRLNFVSREGEILKSYVSRQIPPDSEVSLTALGPVPDQATHIISMIQFNNCLDGEYIISDLKLHNIDLDTTKLKQTYPCFNIPLQFNFIWLPHL